MMNVRFDELELMLMAMFEQKTLKGTIQTLTEVQQLVEEDAEMAVLVQQSIQKLQQLNEQQFKGLELEWYKPDEQRRDAVSPIVVDSKGVFVTEAPNGFENVRATITEYVRRAERKQQDVTEHEKCLTNGTYERARESGTEQNYNMIDGCVNNNPRKPRVIGNRVSVLDRLHIKLEERKQKEQGQQQQQERTLKN